MDGRTIMGYLTAFNRSTEAESKKKSIHTFLGQVYKDNLLTLFILVECRVTKPEESKCNDQF